MNFLLSITVTAPRFALGSPSHICWKNTLARPRNGRGFVPFISTWPKKVLANSRSFSEYDEVSETAAFVQAPDRLREKGSDWQHHQLFVVRGIVQSKRRHRIGSDDLVKRRI